MIIGQGDITLIRVGDAEAVEGLTAPVTLAVGEESGHSHVLTAGILVQRGDRKYLNVPQDAKVEVQGMPWRHTPLDVPAGLYELKDAQVEYTPGSIRPVGD